MVSADSPHATVTVRGAAPSAAHLLTKARDLDDCVQHNSNPNWCSDLSSSPNFALMNNKLFPRRRQCRSPARNARIARAVSHGTRRWRAAPLFGHDSSLALAVATKSTRPADDCVQHDTYVCSGFPSPPADYSKFSQLYIPIWYAPLIETRESRAGALTHKSFSLSHNIYHLTSTL